MKKMGTETKVGIFVLLGIIVLVFMTATVGKFRLGKEAGYRVYVLFDSAAGVDRNSPVRIAGVHVGTVERVSLEGGKAKVALRLPPDVRVHKDAKGYLRAEGLLGEKYIDIVPGSEEMPRLGDEGVIQQGAPTVTIDRVFAQLSGIGEDFAGVLRPLGNMLKGIDPEKVRNMTSNLEAFSRDLPDLAADTNEMLANLREISARLERGEGTLGKLLSDEELYRDAKDTVLVFREMAEKVQKGEGTLGKLLTDDEAYQEATKTLVAWGDVAEKIQRGEGTLGKLISDDEAYRDARATLANLRRVSERLDRGEGVLGKLITDEELSQDVEKTVKKVQKAAEGVQEQQPITALALILGLIF
jgi:phospholipid/cholesterol/gamma-HCH transport system substrate-binding protein